MRKILAIVLLLCSPAVATNWYATGSGGNMSTTTWKTGGTVGSCAMTGGSTLTWASRAAGDNFYANGCTGIIIDVDPGVGGSPVTLRNDNTNSATAGGNFTLSAAITATISVTAGGTTPTGNGAVQITGSNAISLGCSTCVFQGGTATNSQAIADTHTTSTVTVIGTAIGGSASTTQGYNYSAASGTVNGASLNCVAGSVSVGCNLASTGSTMTVNNCVAFDGSAGANGCNASAASSAGAMTLKGSDVGGKYQGQGVVGKVIYSPASSASSMYRGINSSYASTDIVDASGNVKGSPTLTNVIVFPVAYTTSGIGTGCAPTGCSNVLSGVTFGPYTGSAASGGGNSGSAH